MIINVDTIGETIRKLRTERGLTQEKLAEASGVASSAIVSLELGYRKSGGTVDTLLRLLHALGMECVARCAGMEDKIIQVNTVTGWQSVRGWTHPDVAGLAVAEIRGSPCGASVYSVTHLYSGKRLIPVLLESRDETLRCIRWLGKEADRLGFSWDVALEEIELNLALARVRRRAMDIYAGGDGDA